MRRCNHANIHLLGTGAAQSFKLTLLEHPQQLRLHFEWNVTYFIEEHGAFVCNLEAACLASDGAGKCAPFMTKKFAFQQPRGNRRAIQFCERSTPPSAQLVDRSGDQFLSRTSLPQQ